MNSESLWDQISSNYESYLQEMGEAGHISVSGETEKPNQEIIKGNIGLSIGEIRTPQSEEYLISFRDTIPDIPELPIEILERLGTELINLLEQPISRDHKVYWEWTYTVAEELTRSRQLLSQELWGDLRCIFDLALCEMVGAPFSHESNVTSNSHRIAAYLSYPLLEGLTKRMCPEDFEEDGTVKQNGRVERFHGEDAFYEVGSECNRIHEILWHLENTVANSVLKQRLTAARNHIGKFGDRPEGQEYGLISDWRNQLVHGERSAGVQFGVILNIICIIIWDCVRTDTVVS
jgi:hypothetical protein